MRERQRGCVEELPAERRLGHAVDGVTDDREIDRGEMDADLVHPPRLQAHLEQCVRVQATKTSKCVTASRGDSLSSEIRVGSSRSRPIGASIRPLREAGRPRTRAM